MPEPPIGPGRPYPPPPPPEPAAINPPKKRKPKPEPLPQITEEEIIDYQEKHGPLL